jgi:hypothetical protein
MANPAKGVACTCDVYPSKDVACTCDICPLYLSGHCNDVQGNNVAVLCNMVYLLLGSDHSVSSMIIHVVVRCYSPFYSRLVAWLQQKSLRNPLGPGTTADGPTIPEAADIEQPAPQHVMAPDSAMVGDDAQNQIPLKDFSSVPRGHVVGKPVPMFPTNLN